jgi:aspartyl-tRNA(Asn)/glutamyl-tRNA(Gln) amidotransferase subunit C
MEFNDQKLEKIAALASLENSEGELLREHLHKIMNLIGMIEDVNTEGVEPLVIPNVGNITLMDDRVEHSISAEEVLKNAPKKKYNYFAVPKIID